MIGESARDPSAATGRDAGGDTGGDLADAADATRTEPRLLIGVSLKMYFGHDETLDWCARVADMARRHPAVVGGVAELVVLPSFPSLPAAREALAGSAVRLGAQNLFWEDRGPYTGEVSGPQLKQVGCDYVEIGHAERRRMFAEDDQAVAAKVVAALRNDLVPIICVGEPDPMPAGDAAACCIAQLDAALAQARALGMSGRIIAAYEPEWAIGAEQPARPEHIAEVGAVVKEWLHAGGGLPDGRLIYGGSAGPGLLGSLGPSVDGLFLGRFAHDTDPLTRILDEAMELVG